MSHIQGTFGRNSAVQGTWGRNSAVSGIAGIRPSVFGHLAAEEPPRQITGNPSDKAVFTFCNLFKDIEETRREWPQLYIMCVGCRRCVDRAVGLCLRCLDAFRGAIVARANA